MKKICAISKKEFFITEDDLKFYEKMGVPTPTLCPKERMRRRLAFRNERNLYQRKCDCCQKNIISMIPPEAEFPVYCQTCWWKDDWNAKDFARDFDFLRPFFEQFYELKKMVPHGSRCVDEASMENSDFSNCAGELKDCFLIFNSDENEKCMYGRGIMRSFECLDCYFIFESEGCYEVLNSYNCFFCSYLFDSKNCDNCHFSANLIGCKNCFGCVNMQQKENYFMNEKCKSEEEWKKKVTEVKERFSNEELLEHFTGFKKKFPVKFMQEINTENCSGDFIYNSKNIHDCYDCESMEDSKFCHMIKGKKICANNYDVSVFGLGVQNSYECLAVGYDSNELRFCYDSWRSSDMEYCAYCMNDTKNCFGCIGLKHAQYCIFNKQYSKGEYFRLRDKIIAHMKDSREWGEFFPIETSTFAYNKSVAHEYYPMTKDEVLARGWKWQDEDLRDYKPQTCNIPEKISDVHDKICREILACECCKKNYKIQKTELKFYRKINLPIPHKCPNCRYADRIKLRNPRKLWERNCDKCGAEIQTTFAPERTGKVYCEKCYLDSVE